MHDPDTFETRLTVAVRRFAADDPRNVDASALSRTIAADARAGRSRGYRARRGQGARRPWARVLVLAALVALLAIGTAIVGSQLLQPSPAPLIPADRGVFTPSGSMQEQREDPTATLLQDGRVLVVGGYGSGGQAEIWDLKTMTFTPTGSLAVGRSFPSATLLPDGRVLIMGGSLNAYDTLPFAEVWDPGTESFSDAGSIPEAHEPPGTLLDDGRILTFQDGNASVWDPRTRSSTPAGSRTPDYLTRFTATRLRDGRVLVAGGGGCVPGRLAGGMSGCAIDVYDAAEIWDPSSMSFSQTGSMVQGRWKHAAVLLNDGRVLIVGNSDTGDGSSAEVFELR